MIKIKKGIPLYDQHDKNYMYGGKFGGNYIPESLKNPIDDLTKLFEKCRYDKSFIRERDWWYDNYLGTPTRFIRLDNLTRHLGGAQVWAKMVSDYSTGSHKALTSITHALLCKRAGKKILVTDTGAGENGKAYSIIAKAMGLKLFVFMGSKDIKRQKPNVNVMRSNGAEIVPVTTGSASLVDAVSECIRFFVSNNEKVHMGIGSLVGPAPYVKVCGWSTAQISKELIIQVKNTFGRIPKKMKIFAAVGGGSSSYGIWNSFFNYSKKQVELIGVEAQGPKNGKLHAAPLSNNSKIAIMHGFASYCAQDKDGNIADTDSCSAGLDYPSTSPIHSWLKDNKRVRFTSATDEEALSAFELVNNLEEISPSLEVAHPAAEIIKIAPKLSQDSILILSSCGDSKKDSLIIKKKLGYYRR